jgi:hypothetical protein
MFQIFKKINDKAQPNAVLIKNWENFCDENGLSFGQKLGCAYHSGLIATVLSNTNENLELLKPLAEVVPKIGTIDSNGANVLYIYREYYWNAATWSKEVFPQPFDGLPENFYTEENPFIKYTEAEFGYFRRSRVSVMLMQRIGKILEDYKIDVTKAFELGHYHANFLLSTDKSLTIVKSFFMANIFPNYMAEIIDYLPKRIDQSPLDKLWIFSKIFYRVISSEYESNHELKTWLWSLHNSIFYENVVGSIKIRDEWSLEDPNFELNMLKKLMSSVNNHYKSNGNSAQYSKINGIDFKLWEEFFPILNQHLKTAYEVLSPNTAFINKGELCNYLAYKFLATTEIILNNRN